MSANDWDITIPLDHLKIGDVPGAIRDAKASAKVILTKEHETPGTDNAGGQHRTGSARVYLISGLPLLDPEGNNLETNADGDDGRLSVNTADGNELRVYRASATGISTGWWNVRVGVVKAAEDIDANAFSVVSLASGTQTGEAIHLGQVDTRALTGQLKLLEPSTDSKIAVAVLDPPTEDGHIASKKFVDDTIKNVLSYAYSVASGTAPSAATRNAWTKFPLNAELIDIGSLGSLASNQITLEAGTYTCEAFMPNMRARGAKLRLRDTTGGATLIIGLTVEAYDGINESNLSVLSGAFTIGVQSVLELQYYFRDTDTVAAFSNASSTGENEVYGVITLTKR